MPNDSCRRSIDHAVALKVYHGSTVGNFNLTQGTVARTIGVDMAIAMKLSQPNPLITTNQLEFF